MPRCSGGDALLHNGNRAFLQVHLELEALSAEQGLVYPRF